MSPTNLVPGSLLLKVVLEQVRRRLRRFVLHGRDPVGARLHAVQVVFAHHASHRMHRHPLPLGGELALHLAVAEDAVRVCVHRFCKASDLGATTRRRRRGLPRQQ